MQDNIQLRIQVLICKDLNWSTMIVFYTDFGDSEVVDHDAVENDLRVAVVCGQLCGRQDG